MNKISLTDEELILAFQGGDRDAFNHIVERYKDKLTNFLYRFCLLIQFQRFLKKA